MSDEKTNSARPAAGSNDAARSGFPRDKDANSGMGGGDARPKGKRRRKVSILTTQKIATVDYKEVALLRRFLNEHGRILPARQTGNTAKQQRMIASAIRRAREMALLPFVVRDMIPEVRPSGARRERTYHERHAAQAHHAQQAQQAEEQKAATETTETA